MSSEVIGDLGDIVIEGKTKIVYALPNFESGNHVLMRSKDKITCGDGARQNVLTGKGAVSNATNGAVYSFLNSCGVPTHYHSAVSETDCIVARCEMIPIEVVTRRLATGSFLKRNPGVKECYRFPELKLEYFFKDDANHDPQWSREQILECDDFTFAGLKLGRHEIDEMSSTAIAVFELLEKAWASRNCVLVDMKVEFGVNVQTKRIVLADVIDNDSWRLWPAGDKKLMKDKQVYRNLKEVTSEAMVDIKKNYDWVKEETMRLTTKPLGRVVILMGSPSDKAHCEKITKKLDTFSIIHETRVTSAHKGTDETMRILREYECNGIPTVFVAVAGRSNGLGPVLSGNTSFPVINCPPVKADWGSQDVWSSLRLPSGLGCPTVIDPEAAALAAAQILGIADHNIWCKLRGMRLNIAIDLMQADKKFISEE